jgi:hypothetical protein
MLIEFILAQLHIEAYILDSQQLGKPVSLKTRYANTAYLFNSQKLGRISSRRLGGSDQPSVLRRVIAIGSETCGR